MPALDYVTVQTNGQASPAVNSPPQQAVNDLPKAKPATKWQGRTVHEAKLPTLAYAVAFVAFAALFVYGLSLATLTGYLLSGISVLTLYNLVKSFVGPSEIEEAGKFLAGSLGNYNQLKTVEFSKLNNSFELKNVSEPMMRVTDKKGNTIGICFKYKRELVPNPNSNRGIAPAPSKDITTIIEVYLFQGSGSRNSDICGVDKYEKVVLNSFNAEHGKKLEAIFKNNVKQTEDSYSYYK